MSALRLLAERAGEDGAVAMPRMTQRYAHLSPDFMAGAVNKLDGVFAGALPEST